MSMDNPRITIRPATPKDVDRIAKLGRAIFLQSYRHPFDEKDMGAYIEKYLSAKRVAQELNYKTFYYYVAEVKGSIVGFVKFKTFMRALRFKGKVTFEVERLYIQKDMESQSIGSRLMAKTIEIGKQKDYKIIWLSVWENNTRAINFHQNHGFEIIGDGIFTLGDTQRKYLIMLLKS